MEQETKRPLRSRAALAVGAAALLVTGSIVGGGIAFAGSGSDGDTVTSTATTEAADVPAGSAAGFAIAVGSESGEGPNIVCGAVKELSPEEAGALKERVKALRPLDEEGTFFSEASGDAAGAPVLRAFKDGRELTPEEIEALPAPPEGDGVFTHRFEGGEPGEGTFVHCDGELTAEAKAEMLARIEEDVAAGRIPAEVVDHLRERIESMDSSGDSGA